MKNAFVFQKTALPWAVMFIFWMFFGCAGSYGRLQSGDEITRAFEQMHLPENYLFYYNGRANMPYAIVGIKQGYTLRSELWKPVNPETDQFRKMVANPYSPDLEPPHGARILDSSGKQVGIWYSTYYRTTVQVTEEKQVIVHSPYEPACTFIRCSW